MGLTPSFVFLIEYHVFVFMCECEFVFDVGFYEIIVSGVLCFVLFLLICVSFLCM